LNPEALRCAAILLFGERGWMSRLAEALGVDRSTVSRWFAGLPVPGPAAAAVTAWLELYQLTGRTPVASEAPEDPSANEAGGSFS
jgi:transcriptional regulator with XRE-family HTH domain